MIENLFLIFFSIPFLYFNYKILFSDIKNKIIPNKYLWLLLLIIPFYYIFILLTKDISFLSFIFWITLSFFISFLLYYLWVWSAWDAKYLLVLSLFIPHIWIIPFIWNLWLLTICYLLIYFIYFYLWKCLFKKNFAKHLAINIYWELKDKFFTFISNKDWNVNKILAIYKILKWFVLFLMIFVSIRLTRLYIIQHFLINTNQENLQTWWFWGFIYKFATEHSFEFILWLLFIFFWIIYLIHKTIISIRKFIAWKIESRKEWWINPIFIDLIFIFILSLVLIFYIIFEYIKEPEIISNNLKLIFTFYIIIYLIFRLAKYSYKITFQLWEEDFVKIDKLKVWDIVDKPYLINIFWTQNILWAPWVNQNEKWILYPNPKEYFENLWNPVDNDTIIKLKEIFKIVNEHHNKNSKNIIDSLKILKTFAFWPYIFLWFIITFLIWSKMFEIINNYLYNYFKIIINN